MIEGQDRANGLERNSGARGRRLQHLHVVDERHPQLHSDGNGAGVETNAEISPNADRGIHQRIVVERRLIPHLDLDVPAQGANDQPDFPGVVQEGGFDQTLDLHIAVLEFPRDELARTGPGRNGQRTAPAGRPNPRDGHGRVGFPAGDNSIDLERISRTDPHAAHLPLELDGAGIVLHEEDAESAVDVSGRPAKMDRNLPGNRIRSDVPHLLCGRERSAAWRRRGVSASAQGAQHGGHRQLLQEFRGAVRTSGRFDRCVLHR